MRMETKLCTVRFHSSLGFLLITCLALNAKQGLICLIQNIVVHNCPSSSKWKHMVQTCSRTCAETPT